MKNLVKGLIFASIALSFGACKNDKPAADNASTATTETMSKAAPAQLDTAAAVSTSMATTSAAMPAKTATPPAPTASTTKPATQPVKPSTTQITPPPSAAASAAMTPAGKTTAIKFEESSYAWGSIKEGEKMTHIFKFKNVGSNDLIISDAHGSCGCTVPEWPKEPIKAGKNGEIKVVFDSKGKAGDQQKTVTLTANTEPANTVLTIKGSVKAAAAAQ